MADLSCKTCATNVDCLNDGGFKPNQPVCDHTTGTCIDCSANSDCNATGSILNCDQDGRCMACTAFPGGTTCANFDGPPNTNHINPNCDPLSQLCVDFCTANDQCTDSCNPVCNIDRGCCVECNTNSDCPVPQWRQMAAYTTCSSDFMCVLPSSAPPPSATCGSDADCTGATGKPACSIDQGKCVACLYDAHCPSSTPACDSGAQNCVDCVFDHHCTNIQDSNGHATICNGGQKCVAGAGLLEVSVLVALATAIAHLF